MSTNDPTRIIHTADTHVGYRQYHRPEREDDYLKALSQVIDAALEEDVDAVVHAGDLFDSSRPSTDRIYDVLSELQRLVQADIPFLSIVGNHDGRRDRQWLDIFEDIGYATRLGSEGTTVGAIELYGLDHVDRSHRDELSYEYDDPSDGTELSALVAHGLFTPFPNGDWDSQDVVQSATVEFDLILAGDDHTPQSATLDTGSETQITYPGSTERTAADQREPRGYHLITIDPDGELDSTEGSNEDGIDTGDTSRVSTERRLLDTRPFVYIDVELEPDEGSEKVLETVRNEVGDIEDEILVVTISGDGERVPAGPIEEFGLERGALVVRVNDRRTLEEDMVEYNEVSFADPESAIEERKQELNLSKAGNDLENLVRSDNVASTNIKSTSEERVKEWVGERSLDDFERKEAANSDESAPSQTDGDGADDDGHEELDEQIVDRVETEASTMETTATESDETPPTDSPEDASSTATEPTSEASSSTSEDQPPTGEENTQPTTDESDTPENEDQDEEDNEGGEGSDTEKPTDEESDSGQTTLF